MGRETYKYEKYISSNNETRWASSDEIKAEALRLDLSMDCCECAGIPLISDGRIAYVDDQDSHTLIWGSTGAKKTRLLSMPLTNICIKAGESFVVMDPKGELYDRTSGMADKYGYEIVVLNFRDLEKGDCWNPLSIPYQMFKEGKQDEAMCMINDFIQILSDGKSNERDPYWSIMAKNYILANMIFLLKYGKKEDVNLASVGKMSSLGENVNIKKCISCLDEDSIEKMNYSAVMETPDRTRACIISTAYSMVSMFNTQKRLVDKLGTDTFDIRELAVKKMAVYLIVPDEKTTYHFLGATFVKQAYEMMIEQAQKRDDRKLPIRLNFILEEFCNFPQIPDMPSMITAARSRNIRFFLFVQGERQLAAKYHDDASTIKGNCDNWIFLNSRELKLLNEISELCGKVHGEGGEMRPLISLSQLQRLRKQEGEVMILYHRNYPFISYLADIDDYVMFEKIQTKDMSRISYECQMVNMEVIYEALPGFRKKEEESKEKILQLIQKSRENRKLRENNTLKNKLYCPANCSDYDDDDYDDDDFYEERSDESGKEKKSIMDRLLDTMQEKNDRIAELNSDDAEDLGDAKTIMDKKSEHMKQKKEEE